MKQPKKLTRSQKGFLSKKGYNPEEWMLQSEDTKDIVFIHKASKKSLFFQKPI